MDPVSCTKEFVEAYRSLPCLWNTLDPSYRNGLQRRRALTSLAARFEMNAEAVRKKIDNLRSYFRRELGKETESLILGINAYKSHWVHFETLAFLKGHFTKRNSGFSMDPSLAGYSGEAGDIGELEELPPGSTSPAPLTPPAATDGTGAGSSYSLSPPSTGDGGINSAATDLHSDRSQLPSYHGAGQVALTAVPRRRGIKRCHYAATTTHCCIDDDDGECCYEQLSHRRRIVPLRSAGAQSLAAVTSPTAAAATAAEEDHLDKFGQHMVLMLRKLDMRTQALLLAKFSQLIADHMPGP